MTVVRDLALAEKGHEELLAKIKAWLDEQNIKAKFELRTDKALERQPYVRYSVTFENPEQAELAYKMPLTHIQ